MATWERARSAEQKHVRESEILAAARRLLPQKPFERIALSDISQGVSFSRASIYQYFASKEEVYLVLLSEEIRDFGELVEKHCRPAPQGEDRIAEFSTAWAGALGKEKILLHLLSMAGTVLEKNCSDEILLRSKKTMALTMAELLLPALRRYFPRINAQHGNSIILQLVITANGLWPLCALSASQKQVLQANGLQERIHEFEPTYRAMVEAHLRAQLGST